MSTPSPSAAHVKRRILVWCLVFLVCGLLAFAIFRPVTNQPVAGKRSSSGAPISVSIATAQKGNIEIKNQALGTVTPLTNVVLRTQINGYLVAVRFQEGQIVQKGDVIADIDSRPYELSETLAAGSLTRDEALLKDAQLNFDRYKKLFSEAAIAKQQLDTQESLVAQYRGAVETDHAQVDQAKLNITYCHITAPISGRLGLRQIDIGNYAQTSDTNGLVTLTQLQPISVIFALPEDDLTAIMQRMKEGATLEVTAFDRTRSQKLATGKLIAVDNQVDTTTGTVKFRAQFDNDDESLFPNQFVNVDILVSTLQDALIIPSAAVQRGSPGTYVYRINADSTVSIVPIKLGPSSGLNVAVTDGLSVGDKVVIDGTDKLREGTKINLPSDQPAAAASAEPPSGDNPSSATPDKGTTPSDPMSPTKHHKRSAP